MKYSPESLFSPENSKLEVLREDFCDMFDESKRDEAEDLFKEITEEYESEVRKYHNLEHIEKMLAFLEIYKQKIKDVTGVKLAIYFHDIVYNTKETDNEEQSALYAENYLKRLGISEDIVKHVLVLILATKKHEIIEDDIDSEIFLDGDLEILGSDEKEYDDYAKKIREEYFWVPDDQYCIGRKRVLQHFLNKPKIYFTKQVGERLEHQARKNIEREIARLS